MVTSSWEAEQHYADPDDDFEPEVQVSTVVKPISLRITPDQRRLLECARDEGGITKGQLHCSDWRRLDALVSRGLMRLTFNRRNTHLVTDAGLDAIGRQA